MSDHDSPVGFWTRDELVRMNDAFVAAMRRAHPKRETTKGWRAHPEHEKVPSVRHTVSYPSSLKGRWEATGNPYWVWTQIGICCRWGLDFPDWALSYLERCAERMTSREAARERDLRKALPKIFDFPKNSRGAGHLLDPGGTHDPRWLEYAKSAVEFEHWIERGANPTSALAKARLASDSKVLGRVDDRTLLRHIKKILCVTGTPRSNVEWRAALHGWIERQNIRDTSRKFSA
jgi:hypothetical protein